MSDVKVKDIGRDGFVNFIDKNGKIICMKMIQWLNNTILVDHVNIKTQSFDMFDSSDIIPILKKFKELNLRPVQSNYNFDDFIEGIFINKSKTFIVKIYKEPTNKTLDFYYVQDNIHAKKDFDDLIKFIKDYYEV